MTAMEPHSAMLFDETSHTSGGPQLGAEAIGHRPLAIAPLSSNLTILRRCRSVNVAGRPGENCNLQGLRPAALAGISPAHHRTRRNVESAADLVERKPSPSKRKA